MYFKTFYSTNNKHFFLLLCLNDVHYLHCLICRLQRLKGELNIRRGRGSINIAEAQRGAKYVMAEGIL